jgi:hypothetical protein
MLKTSVKYFTKQKNTFLYPIWLQIYKMVAIYKDPDCPIAFEIVAR